MKKTFSSKKSAFSLIELSIVLIVIGLLIAGITGGASLIKSSELRSVMSEARGYAVAVNAFYSQYDALPGDYGTAVGSVSTNRGNGNGNIEYGVPFNTLAGSEGSVAWYALRQIGAIDDALTYAAVSTAQTPGTNIPNSKIKSAGWVMSYIDFTNNVAGATGTQNTVVLTRATTALTANATDATGSVAASLLPSDALSIDAKIDDGTANTGKLRSVINSASATVDTGCSNTGTYTIGGTVLTCAISYQIDVNS